MKNVQADKIRAQGLEAHLGARVLPRRRLAPDAKPVPALEVGAAPAPALPRQDGGRLICTYEATPEGVVTCLRCGRRCTFSWARKYCPNCNQYHENNLVEVGRISRRRIA
jgi:hypothetical protein